MPVNTANEIEKKYGPIDFFDPTITFGYNEIQFESQLTFLEESYVFISFLPLLITFFILHSLWMTIFFAGCQLYYIYQLITSRSTAKIDFTNKKIQISNPNSLINYGRKILKRQSEISFHEIHSFKNYSRKSNWIKNRPNILVVKCFDHSPIKIAKFRFKKDSGTMAELLNHHIVGKARIIE